MAEKNQEKGLAVQQETFGITMPAKSFQAALTDEHDKREMLMKYIKDSLQEGIDYGCIHIYKECPNHKTAYKQKDCPDWHFSKPTLFKAGSEKFSNQMPIPAM